MKGIVFWFEGNPLKGQYASLVLILGVTALLVFLELSLLNYAPYSNVMLIVALSAFAPLLMMINTLHTVKASKGTVDILSENKRICYCKDCGQYTLIEVEEAPSTEE